MDRGAWWARVHGVAKGSDTTERLHCHFDLNIVLMKAKRMSIKIVKSIKKVSAVKYRK